MTNKSGLHDNMHVLDSVAYNGKLVAQSEAHEIIGEVEIVYRSRKNGRVVFTRTLNRNDLLVTGAVFLSEKVNQIRALTYFPSPLDVKHGVHAIEDRFGLDGTTYLMNDTGTIPYERINGIMIGRGGCGETYNQIHRVCRTDLEVPGIIPFRTISLSDGQEDLTGDERKLYFMRTRQTINGKDCICYYGKRFLAKREINVQWEDGTIVDINTILPGNDRGKLVKTFTKFTTSISSKDVREYCKIAEGTTIRSLVNSIGLMTGFPVNPEDNTIITPTIEATYDDPYEFAMVRGMTTLNTEDYPFKDSESTMDITYRLYFI